MRKQLISFAQIIKFL